MLKHLQVDKIGFIAKQNQITRKVIKYTKNFYTSTDNVRVK